MTTSFDCSLRARTLAAALLVALVAGLVGLLAPPALAQTEPAARSTWAIQPATGGAPDTRGSFTLDVAPGTRIEDAIAVSNLGATPLTLDVYARDAFTTPVGGFDLLDRAKQSRDAGSWIQLGAEQVTIAPGARATLPVVIDVPADASPGDHAAGIVAALVTPSTDAKGNQVDVERRVGTRVYLRVSGDLRPALEIDDLEVSYSGSPFGSGEVTATWTVRNSGNTRVQARGDVTASGPLNDVSTATRVPEILPGATLQRSARLAGVKATGPVDVEVHLDAEVVDHPEQQRFVVSASAGLWAVPWLVVLILVVIVAALTTWVVLRRRTRRRATDATSSRAEA